LTFLVHLVTELISGWLIECQVLQVPPTLLLCVTSLIFFAVWLLFFSERKGEHTAWLVPGLLAAAKLYGVS